MKKIFVYSIFVFLFKNTVLLSSDIISDAKIKEEEIKENGEQFSIEQEFFDALEKQKIGEVKKLIRKIKDINSVPKVEVNKIRKLRPILIAFKNDNREILKLFIEHERLDLFFTNFQNNGLTIFDAAINDDQKKFLFNEFSNEFVKAAKYGNLKRLREILKLNALFLNKLDCNGDSALTVATQNAARCFQRRDCKNSCEKYEKYLEVIKFLLDQSLIDVNIKDASGFTALMYACYGNLQLVEILVDKKADVNIENHGKTALSYARERNCEEIISYLSQKTKMKNAKKRTIKRLSARMT